MTDSSKSPPPTTITVNGAAQKHPGLLPTSSVDTNNASKDPQGSSNFTAGAGVYASTLAGHHDKEYYEQWNREREEAFARGEDPNAKFIAMVKQREQAGCQGKLRRFLGRFGSKEKEGKVGNGEKLRDG